MNEWLMTVWLGIVEGITEFLPVSSTGHLLLLQFFFDYERSEFFNVGIQAGAVSAVVLIYWKRLWNLTYYWRQKENLDFILKITAAFFITAILGLAVRKAGFSLEDSNAPAVISALVIGGLLMIFAEKKLQNRTTASPITWPVALIAGIAQVIAGVFPGTSRSAATIIAALWLGVPRTKATEFSFLLGIPTMFAASGYLFLEDFQTNGWPSQHETAHFILGFAVSTVVAFIAVKWLLRFIQSHTFIPFAWYRIALGAALLGWWIWGGQGS